MTLTLTPEPSSGPNDPPRVRADLVAPDGGTFTALSLSRGSSLVRRQPFVGATTSTGYDYEAPFGQPVTYTATGFVLPVTAPDWTESWSSMSNWSGDTSDWSTAAGEASSSVADAAIERDASGVIQRVTVADPVLVRVELLDASSAVVCSLQVDAAKVTLTGSTSAQASGGGSFSLLLDDETVTASADDSSWSLSRPYSGSPESVRLVALGEANVPAETAASTSLFYLAVGPSDAIYGLEWDGARYQVVRFDAELGSRTIIVVDVGVSSVQGMSVGPDGSVYLADYDGSRIAKWDPTGTVESTIWSGARPMSVHAATDGTVYVGSNTPNPRVYAMEDDGTPITDWSVNDRALSIGSDSSGNVYTKTLFYATGSRVNKYSAAGSLITYWTTPSSFTMDVADDRVYVSGPDGSPRVYVYDTAGSPVRDWSIGGAYPSDVAVNSVGDVYTSVVDSGGVATVQRFALSETSLGEVSATPVAEPEPYLSSATTTLVETRAWLIHPSQPSLSVSIDENRWRDTGCNVSIDSAQQTVHEQPVSVFSPPGRPRSVVYPLGPRKAGTWTLGLVAWTLSVRDQILSLLADGAPLLLRSPGWDWDLPDGWYGVGDVTQDRVVRPLQKPHRTLTLPLTPVDSPPVALVPEWTYGDLLLAAPTYGDVLTQYPTYLDVLTGTSA